MKCMLGLLVLFAVSAGTTAGVVRKANEEESGDVVVTGQLENNTNNNNNNNNLDHSQDSGGAAAPRLRPPRSVKSCIQRDCLWPKAADGKVYIPYVISDLYTSQELEIIKKGIISFSSSTCIRFVRRSDQVDYLVIQPLIGCYSYVGRQGNAQVVSLSRGGCIDHGKVQHELLHVLGFSHEQCRSDRDQHIRVLLENVVKGQEYNFRQGSTLNQRTPYDYDSVMHYDRLAFSKDKKQPTMVAFPDTNAVFGTARQMSRNDINRINLLYCTK